MLSLHPRAILTKVLFFVSIFQVMKLHNNSMLTSRCTPRRGLLKRVTYRSIFSQIGATEFKCIFSQLLSSCGLDKKQPKSSISKLPFKYLYSNIVK